MDGRVGKRILLVQRLGGRTDNPLWERTKLIETHESGDEDLFISGGILWFKQITGRERSLLAKTEISFTPRQEQLEVRKIAG